MRELIQKDLRCTGSEVSRPVPYRRASQGKTFYKTTAGRFGRLSLRARTEEVRMPATGIA